jgi:hypothetical protein
MGRSTGFNANYCGRKVREKPDHLMSAQFPAQNNPLIGIHAVKLEHFFRRIHANTDQLGHDGFLHWTVSSSVSSQDRCEPSTPSVLNENQHSGLKDRMMAPEIAAEAMRAYAEETNRLNRERRSNADVWQVEQVKVEKQIRGIIEAIKAGMFHPSMKAEMDTLETRKAELATLLSDVPDDVPDLLPSASAIYARKVGRLTDALNRPEERLEAAEALRALIEKVVLTPGPNRGEIDAMLYGELGTILTWIERQAIGKAEKRNTPGAGLTGVSVSVVAGESNQRYLRLVDREIPHLAA